MKHKKSDNGDDTRRNLNMTPMPTDGDTIEGPLFPVWNSADMYESIRALARWHNNSARLLILNIGECAEYFIIVSDAGSETVIKVDVPPNAQCDLIDQRVRQRVAESNAFGVLHVGEAWMCINRGPGDHTEAHIMAGNIRVPEVASRDRTEALIVSMETRDGHTLIFMNPIVRGKTDTALADAMEFVEPKQGRFTGWLVGS